MKPDRPPEHSMIALSQLCENHAEQQQSSQQRQEFSGRQIKACVHQAEQERLQPERAAMPEQQGQLPEQPAAEEQFFSEANAKAESQAIQQQGRRQLPFPLGSGDQQCHHDEQQQGCSQQQALQQTRQQCRPAGPHTQAPPGSGFPPCAPQAPGQTEHQGRQAGNSGNGRLLVEGNTGKAENPLQPQKQPYENGRIEECAAPARLHSSGSIVLVSPLDLRVSQ